MLIGRCPEFEMEIQFVKSLEDIVSVSRNIVWSDACEWQTITS